MSLEDAIEKNTQAINKLTDAVSASLEGQSEALKALTSIVSKPEQAPVVEKPKKAEPMKQAEPEPEEEDLLVEEDEIVEPALTYDTLMKQFRKVAVKYGGKVALGILAKFKLTRLEEKALPTEKFAEFWKELERYPVNGAKNG